MAREYVSVRDSVGKREKGYNHKTSSTVAVLPIVPVKKSLKEVINFKSRLEKEWLPSYENGFQKNIQKIKSNSLGILGPGFSLY